MSTNPMSTQVAAITGAQGYLGSYLADAFQNKGWDVYRFMRRHPSAKENESKEVFFSLGKSLDPAEFRSRQIKLLVHCAYDRAPASWEDIHRINVEGSIQLFEAAKLG